MSLVLTVDGDRWRTHLRAVAEANPGLVPVAKGNGYGLGLARLARKAQWLGADTLAVGTYHELDAVRDRYHGSLLVLTPWRPFDEAVEHSADPRVVHTISRVEDLTVLLSANPEARFVLELMTSMRRHGLGAGELQQAAELLPAGARLEGIALHLPLSSHHGYEVETLLTEVTAAGLTGTPIWVSHLSAAELEQLRGAYGDHTWRPRIGTSLWLGVRDALRVTGTVLDVHSVLRGHEYGYRARRASKAGHLLVVSGGTAHGIGLAAPTGALSMRAGAASVARGGLDAVGKARSPFWVDGEQCWFAEPPHMQASMLWAPPQVRLPAVGDRLELQVRFTATTFDRTVIS
ncbi:alanine racemase [Nocardioides limicola]|uniref:alanine racemase n=1 Tax=Nocardioides limicola TaxID=2803368 RepID=UPI00193C5960|nr:alanine racemase [Nocardioides sp. DJM-14]